MFKGLKKAIDNIDAAFYPSGGAFAESSKAQLRVGRRYSVGGLSLRVTQPIAEGGYSYVYVVENVFSRGDLYALKLITKCSDDILRVARAEIDLLRQLPEHPCIMSFVAGEVQGAEALIVTELIDGGSLAEKLTRRAASPRQATFTTKEVLTMFADVCEAVTHLHSQRPPIAHRDIKLENVLYDRYSQRYKLCDFGSCTTIARRYEQVQELQKQEEVIAAHSTLMYRAPEMVDLYQRKILNAKYSIPENPEQPDDILKMIAWLLNPEADQRPDSSRVLQAVRRMEDRFIGRATRPRADTKSEGPARPRAEEFSGATRSRGTTRSADSVNYTTTKTRETTPAPTNNLIDLSFEPRARTSTGPKPGDAQHPTHKSPCEDNWANFDDAFRGEVSPAPLMSLPTQIPKLSLDGISQSSQSHSTSLKPPREARNDKPAMKTRRSDMFSELLTGQWPPK